MYIKSAFDLWLREQGRSVVTEYDLALVIANFYKDKMYNGEPISVKKTYPDSRDIRRNIRHFIEENILSHDLDVGGYAYKVNIFAEESAEDVVCTIDPFTYISHLSAMQRHGITNRSPKELGFSRPNRSLWRKMAMERAIIEFGEELFLELPMAHRVRPVFYDEVRKRHVRLHDVRYPGAAQKIRNSQARVSSIGQTFLDTLTQPEWCGGMGHVLSVWEEHAGTFLEEIIEAIDRAPTKLVKVRAGYILDELVNVEDSRIEAWLANAQRGSSQKLDPQENYKSEFSEKWMISINAQPEGGN